jgi:hypothetical protein
MTLAMALVTHLFTFIGAHNAPYGPGTELGFDTLDLNPGLSINQAPDDGVRLAVGCDVFICSSSCSNLQ